MTPRRAAMLVALVLCAAALAACGERHEQLTPASPTQLRIALGRPGAGLYAPVYAALGEREFTRAGLDVSLQPAVSDTAALRSLENGGADVAIASEPDLLLQRDAGQQLLGIGALVQSPLEAIVSLGRRRVASAAQLQGRTVLVPGALQAAELATVLRTAGIPARSVRVHRGSDPARVLIAGQVEAAIGALWNYDAVVLGLRRLRPTAIHVEDAGVPRYSQLVLVVRADEAHRDGPQLRAFLQALAHGAEDVRRDPTRAMTALRAANPRTSSRLSLAIIHATLPVYLPAAGKPFGYQQLADWQRFGDWMLAAGLLRRAPAGAAALTNEFLPGQGE